jgi:Uma2 family endonuclease
MSQSLPHLPSKDGEPAWEAAYFFPPQGRWSEETFLQFHTNQMAELVNGHLEMLPMPNVKHQRILRLLLGHIESAMPKDSMALFAPLPTKLFPGTIREPDLLYIAPENIPGPEIEYPSKLDLAVEIVSDGAEARKRDYEDKRIDYAKAGIREYWIVDPQDRVVTVLVLEGEQYIEHGRFTCGQTATGKLIPAFAVDVQSIMSV